MLYLTQDPNHIEYCISCISWVNGALTVTYRELAVAVYSSIAMSLECDVYKANRGGSSSLLAQEYEMKSMLYMLSYAIHVMATDARQW